MRHLGISQQEPEGQLPAEQQCGGVMAMFWEKDARIRWVATVNPAHAAHNYEEVQGYPPQVHVEGQGHHRSPPHAARGQEI